MNSGVDKDGLHWTEEWVEILLINMPNSRNNNYRTREKTKEIMESIKKKGLNVIPPVVLYKCQRGRHSYCISDGNHRLVALQMLGYVKVYARIYDVLPRRNPQTRPK
jgi:ParB-like chromosome segregation protein Spo0J